MAPNRRNNPSSSNKSRHLKKSPPLHNQKEINATTPSNKRSSSAKIVSISLQEALLNVYSTSFPDLLSPFAVTDALHPLQQEIKRHLYNRDFDKAFGRGDLLAAYAVRWSATRTLGYLEIFSEVFQYLRFQPPFCDAQCEARNDNEEQGQLDFRVITCFGGGAGAELCALAGLNRVLPGLVLGLDVTAIDISDWSSIISKLHVSITSSPLLSAYASASARAANNPLMEPKHLRSTFHRLDLLQPSETAQQTLNNAIAASALVTIMFTLNELYSTSLSKTQKLLLDLTASISKGALLLVVDSPGSYSTVTVNQSEKKYPMSWLLDHTLLNVAHAIAGASASSRYDERNAGTAQENETEELGKDSGWKAEQQEDCSPASVRGEGSGSVLASWEKVVSQESRWFRLPDGLRYPIELENMRYQMHLYRRL